MDYNRLLVGSNIGALTCFIGKSCNKIYGLSAFHVLSGENRIIDIDQDIVKIKDNSSGDWIEFGRTVEGRFSAGLGNRQNFGILDYAIFQIANPFIPRIQNQLKDLSLSRLLEYPDINGIKGKNVYGFSVTNENYVKGRIAEIFYENKSGQKFDAVIELAPNFSTNTGDSGMLWKDEAGEALFMHIRGNDLTNARFSFSTNVSRITKIYSSKLYEFI
jgi:hypothetical protein